MVLPVFLLGFQRSGTNMTVWTLDKSPVVTLYNENDDRAFKNFKLLPLNQIKDLIAGTPSNIALFKPITDSMRMIDFLSSLENLKIVYIFRHYLDVISSHQYAFGQKGYDLLKDRVTHAKFLEFKWFNGLEFVNFSSELSKYKDASFENLIAISWIEHVRRLIDAQAFIHKQVKVCNYEDICINPQKEYSTMFEFCSVPFDNSYVQNIRNARSQPIYCDLLDDIAVNAEIAYAELCFIKDYAFQNVEVYEELKSAQSFIISSATRTAGQNAYFYKKRDDQDVTQSTVTLPKFELDKLKSQLEDSRKLVIERYDTIKDLQEKIKTKNQRIQDLLSKK